MAASSPDTKSAGLPLSLRESIQLALKNNHDVLKAADALEGAHAKLSSARSQFFPKIDFEFGAGTFHDRIPQPGDVAVPLVPRDRNNYVAQLNLSQNIFAGFQHSSATRRYDAEVQAASLTLEIAKEQAIEEVIGLYFAVQLYEDQIEAEKEVQVFRENQLKEVEHRLRQGTATDLQQLQALYAVKQQVPKLQQLETELSSKRLDLYRRLNLPLDGVYTLTDPLPTSGIPIPFTLPTLPEALDFALKNNFRVKKLDFQFQSLQAESGEALAKNLPSLSLELSAGTNAYQQQDFATANSLAYGAQIKLKAPLFSGLDSVSDRKLWHSRLDELKEERAKLREILLNGLNETYRRVEMSTNRIEASRVNLDLTRRGVQRAQHFYTLGRATLPEVLGAYTAHLEAKKESIQDTFDRLIAIFHIKSLLGLGTKFDETEKGQSR